MLLSGITIASTFHSQTTSEVPPDICSFIGQLHFKLRSISFYFYPTYDTASLGSGPIQGLKDPFLTICLFDFVHSSVSRHPTIFLGGVFHELLFSQFLRVLCVINCLRVKERYNIKKSITSVVYILLRYF